MGLEFGVTCRCDGAGCTVSTFLGEDKPSPSQIPEGWYRVQTQMGEKGFIFHSLRCVEKWAKERRAALETNRRRSVVDRHSVRVGADTSVSVNDFKPDNALIVRKRQEGEENQGLVLLAFDGNVQLTKAEVCEATGLSRAAIERHIDKMVEAKTLRIVKEGTPRSTIDVRTYARA